MKKSLLAMGAVFAAVLSIGNTPAFAVPLLQIYIEGSTYDSTTETWVLNSNNTGSLRLWVIGNVDGPGGKEGPIEDVKLSAVYDSSYGALNIAVTGSTTGNYLNFVDNALAANGVYLQTVSNGTTPLLGDGSPLPSHGEYGAGKTWQEFSLGDFTGTSDSLADFNGDTNSPSPTSLGAQINVYDISITPASGNNNEGPFTIHFDAYNHVSAGNHSKYVFAPFSHDGEGETPPPGGGGGGGGEPVVPEPASLILLTVGMLGMGGYGYRRRKVQLSA